MKTLLILFLSFMVLTVMFGLWSSYIADLGYNICQTTNNPFNPTCNRMVFQDAPAIGAYMGWSFTVGMIFLLIFMLVSWRK